MTLDLLKEIVSRTQDTEVNSSVDEDYVVISILFKGKSILSIKRSNSGGFVISSICDEIISELAARGISQLVYFRKL